MITRLHIENFKSLVDFDLPEQPQPLGQFICLVGLNGSGKTTVLQALDFLSQLVIGDMSKWMERREWKSADLTSKIPKFLERAEFTHDGERIRFRRPIRILIPFLVQFKFNGELVEWSGSYNRTHESCTSESVKRVAQNEIVLAHESNMLRSKNADGSETERSTKDQIYSGSILSAFKFQHPVLKNIQTFMAGLRSLEMLTPYSMRRRSRKGEDIGYGGEKLSAFLDTLPYSAWDELHKNLRKFYPSLETIHVSTARGGWKSLLSLETQGISYMVSSGHMNDGMLRIIAILAQAYSQHPILLFDEIENGINPELVEKLVDFLVGLDKQIIVTTHSPMILNYLEDKIAKESVFLLYRDDAGWTRSVRFYEIPQIGEKLKALGPGEVYVDTNLSKLIKGLSAGKIKPEEKS